MTADDLREGIHEPSPEEGDGAPTPSGADAVVAAVVADVPGAVGRSSHGQAVVYVPRDRWLDVATRLRDEERFTQCVDVTVVDHLADVDRPVVEGVTPERFEVVANLLSHPRNLRVRMICEVPE